MLVGTVSSCFAIAQLGEGSADWSIQADFNVRVAAVGFFAATTNEVDAGGCSIGRKVMRKGTSRSSRTNTLMQECLAKCNLVDIVGELAVSSTLT